MAKHQVKSVPHQAGEVGGREPSAVLLWWSGRILTAIVWLSAMIFGLYILAFYVGSIADNQMARWNEVLPKLYEAQTPIATVGIGLHFAAGCIVLMLGCIQLIPAIRQNYPSVHRLVGRIYVAATLLTGFGGLLFILAKGTVGGTAMNIGFSLYGILMIVATVQTFRYAKLRQMSPHRVWALRLFALAIGSWLYRMYYGFWALLTNSWGHTQDFRGPFDILMAFFFYIPNLLVVEAFISQAYHAAPRWLKWLEAIAFITAASLILLGTYFFTRFYWGPGILGL